ncbi:DNA pilot protein [Apis mellifera associated microvirus 18]|nr:DNA pilot protein [Apis mellifera associated microvirus 18]
MRPPDARVLCARSHRSLLSVAMWKLIFPVLRASIRSIDPIVGGALIGGGFNLLSGLFGGSSSLKAQKAANKANLKIAHDNRVFQERMSSTAHQRQVEDMRAAGLNPILSATQGGSSAPQGSSATMVAEDAMGQAVSDAGHRVASTARDMFRLQTDVALADAEIAGKKAAALNAASQAELNLATAKNVTLQRPKLIAEGRASGHSADATIGEAAVRKHMSEYDKKFVPYDAVSSRIFDLIGNTGKAVGTAIHGIRNGFSGSKNQPRSTPKPPFNPRYPMGGKSGR